MADFLSTGVSALLAFQKQIATTGHNISNVNTPGYSRQRVDLATRIPEYTGAGYIGSGVNAVSVQRVYDQFTVDQLRSNTSSHSHLATYYGLASQVDNLLEDPDAGLAPALQSFFDNSQLLAGNPSSTEARDVFLSEADSLAERFHSISYRLTTLANSVNQQLDGLVEEINGYAESIAKVNKDIFLAVGSVGGQPPNDLLDKRDELLRQLAERVPVSTVQDADGAVNVFIGNGQTLVLRDQPQALGITRNPYDPAKFEVALGKDGGGAIVTDFLKGGAIGGVVDFRNEILEPTQNALGQVAMGLAQAFNEQHRQGLDLNNNLGKEFFSVTGLSAASQATAISRVNNDGNANVTFYVDDVSKLTTSDYRLDFDGTDYRLVRLSDNTTADTFPEDVGGYPFSYTSPSEGITLRIDSQPASGDSFVLQPTRHASRDIGVAITNTQEIAAAAPLRSTSAVTNLGDATISMPENLDPTVANFFTSVTIEIGSTDPLAVPPPADQYTVNGGGSWVPFSSPQPIDIGNGWKVDITGTVQFGDKFTVEKADSADGGNGNMRMLADLQDTQILGGNSKTFQNAYGEMVSGVGAKTHQLDINSKAQNQLLEQATQAREAISGVNLDEEAANLIRFQQAYMAAAQSVGIAQTLFQSLLDAVRR